MLKMVWVELVLEQVHNGGVAADLDNEVATDTGSPVAGSPIGAADVATIVCDDLVHRHYADERVRWAARSRDQRDRPEPHQHQDEHRWQQQMLHTHANSRRAELSLGQRAADVIKDPGLVPYALHGDTVTICALCKAHRPKHEPAGNCCMNGALCRHIDDGTDGSDGLPAWLPPDADSTTPCDKAAREIYNMWRADTHEGKLLRRYALTVNNALAVSFLRYSSLDSAGNVIAKRGQQHGQMAAEHASSISAAEHRSKGSYNDWMPSIVVQGRCAVLVSPLEQLAEADRVPAKSGFGQLHAFCTGVRDAVVERVFGTREPEAARGGGTATEQRMQEDGATHGALDDGTSGLHHGYTVDPSMTDATVHTMGPVLGADLEEAIVQRRVSFVAPANCSVQDRMWIATLIRKLTALLKVCNPYVQDCYTVVEVLRQADDNNTLHTRKLYMDANQRPVGTHERQYNNPTDSSELSYMTQAHPKEGKRQRTDFEVRLRASESGETRLWHIDAQNRSFDPTHFVLIHYTGRPGWSKDMRYAERHADGTVKNGEDGQPQYKPLTPQMYYRYYSYHRDGWDDSLFRANRLYQEWIVSAFIKCDDQRLSYLASQSGQTKLRVESYGATVDMLTSDAKLEGGGRRTVLPSTSPGSPRAQIQSYHDSMALSRAAGNPTYFITFTANPTWPEVLTRVQNLEAAPRAVPDNNTQAPTNT